MGVVANLLHFFCFWSLVLVYGLSSCFYLLILLSTRKIFHKESPNERVEYVPPKVLHDLAFGKHKFIKLKGVKLHYVEDGDPSNPLVILIHGLPGFWFCWRKQISSLANHFRVVAVDLRGCGDSETPSKRSAFRTKAIVQDIASLIKSLRHSSAHVICNETSGSIGWELAATCPHLVDKMIFINAPHPFVIRRLFQNNFYYFVKYWHLLFLQVPLLPELLINEKSKSLLVLAVGSPNKTLISKEEVAAYEYTFSRQEDWYGVIHHLRHINLSPIIQNSHPTILQKSVLFIIGSSHPYLSEDTAYRSAEFVERIKIKVVEGGKNSLQVTHFRKMNDEILDFLSPLINNSSNELLTTYKTSLVGRVFDAVKTPYNILTTRKEGQD